MVDTLLVVVCHVATNAASVLELGNIACMVIVFGDQVGGAPKVH